MLHHSEVLIVKLCPQSSDSNGYLCGENVICFSFSIALSRFPTFPERHVNPPVKLPSTGKMRLAFLLLLSSLCSPPPSRPPFPRSLPSTEVQERQECQYGENCTFAYCQEEIDVWTQERKGALSRELLFDPLGTNERRALSVTRLLQLHMGMFMFLCEVGRVRPHFPNSLAYPLYQSK